MCWVGAQFAYFKNKPGNQLETKVYKKETYLIFHPPKKKEYINPISASHERQAPPRTPPPIIFLEIFRVPIELCMAKEHLATGNTSKKKKCQKIDTILFLTRLTHIPTVLRYQIKKKMRTKYSSMYCVFSLPIGNKNR